MPNQSPTDNIWEAMSTMRAMRRLKPDPVPDDLIQKILQAGQWAPSGGNTQRWRFLVVRDSGVKKKVQGYSSQVCRVEKGCRYPWSAPPPISDTACSPQRNASVN